MSDRKPGFYWVRRSNPNHDQEVVVAEWASGSWWLPAHCTSWEGKHFVVIERVQPPNMFRDHTL